MLARDTGARGTGAQPRRGNSDTHVNNIRKHALAYCLDGWCVINVSQSSPRLGPHLITAAQLRAARALLGIDQRKLAELSGLSLPTIQRMEASADVIRGNVDSLMKLVGALDAAGIALIGEGSASTQGGRGVRLKG